MQQTTVWSVAIPGKIVCPVENCHISAVSYISILIYNDLITYHLNLFSHSHTHTHAHTHARTHTHTHTHTHGCESAQIIVSAERNTSDCGRAAESVVVSVLIDFPPLHVAFLQPLCLLLMLKCCFTSTKTVGLLGTGAHHVHLDFHTGPGL